MEDITKLHKTVSVVMCTYNGAQYLHEQLDSIVAQTYPIHELIIQDDKSTDETINIVQEYADKYPYIQFYQNEQNIGFNQNFKETILKATGDFIAISDQDDIWLPEKIARQVELIGEHDICFTPYYGDCQFTPDTTVHRIINPPYSMEYMIFYDSIPGHTMLLKRSFLQEIPYWEEHILYDWWLSIHAHLHKGIIRVNEPLNWHRPHQNSAMTSLMNKYIPQRISRPTYQPYLYGLSNFKRIQKKKAFQLFYTYIYNHTTEPQFQLSHKLSGMLLKKDIFSLFYLCLLCMIHKKTIYYYPDQKGFISYIRSFFYPFIYSYSNIYFEL